jgi:hypothetical protein
MTITIEATPETVNVVKHGIAFKLQIWKGVTSAGVPVVAAMGFIQLPDERDGERFKEDLKRFSGMKNIVVGNPWKSELGEKGT